MSPLSSLEMNLLRRATNGEIPKRAAAKYPHRAAIIFQGRRVAFQELNDNCCRFAQKGHDASLQLFSPPTNQDLQLTVFKVGRTHGVPFHR